MPIFSGGGGLLTRTVTLTHAQILALPTTPVVVVPATQTPNYASDLTSAPLVLGGYVLLSNYAVAYTNVNAAAQLLLNLGSDLGSLPQIGGQLMAQTTLQAGDAFAPLIGADYFTTATAPPLGPIPGAFNHNFFDNAVVLSIDNKGSGNLTGGNAANKLVVSLVYAVASLPVVN